MFCSVSRRSGRVVEGAALEMLFRGNSDEGSNPSFSVHIQYPFTKSGSKSSGISDALGKVF